MTLRSLTMRSELLTLEGQSIVMPHQDELGTYLVQTTPTEPHYWMGNQIILLDVIRPVTDVCAVFDRHFPDANYRAIVWDVPNLDPTLLPFGLREVGARIEALDALTLDGALRDAPAPEGIHIRSLSGADDWAKVEDLQVEIGIEEGFEPVSFRHDYLARRNVSRRAQIDKDLGQWFGAFDGDTLVASMGIFHDTQIARYQQVETRKVYRRRGICSALLRHTARWALDRAPAAQVVIVAEAEGDAGRLYRSMGFAHTETIHTAIKPEPDSYTAPSGLSDAVT